MIRLVQQGQESILFFIALCLTSAAWALSWQDLERDNQRRRYTVCSLFESAIEETGQNGACLVYMGSYGYGIALSDSDIDFALLIPENAVADQYMSLIANFYKKCIERSLFWDQNGWHPHVDAMPDSEDTSDFILSPAKLAKLRSTHPKTTLRYALYNPRYGCGDELLFESFKLMSISLPFYQSSLIAQEKAKTKRVIEMTRREVKLLKKGMRSKSLPVYEMDVKKRWIKPIVELLQYLCMKNGHYPKDVQSSIQILVNHGDLNLELSAAVSELLLFVLDLRSQHGRKVQIKQLSIAQVQKLVDAYDVLEKLAQK